MQDRTVDLSSPEHADAVRAGTEHLLRVVHARTFDFAALMQAEHPEVPASFVGFPGPLYVIDLIEKELAGLRTLSRRANAGDLPLAEQQEISGEIWGHTLAIASFAVALIGVGLGPDQDPRATASDLGVAYQAAG